MADYIPPRDADFDAWGLNFATLIAADPGSYFLTIGDSGNISAVQAAFAAAFALTENPPTRTTPNIAQKNSDRAAAEATYRYFGDRINGNVNVTNIQRADLGLTIRNVTPTPVPQPTTAPALTFRSAAPGIHKMSYTDATTPDSKAKPPGVIGMELWAAIAGTPVTDPALATFQATVTKSPFQVAVGAAAVGQLVTYFARWTTRSGTNGIAFSGPWSAGLTVAAI